MTLYCEIGDKPRVIYRANGATVDSTFQSSIAPIDVSVIPFDNPNLPNELYAFNYSTNLRPKVTIEDMPFRVIGKIRNFRVTRLLNTDVVDGVTLGNWEAAFDYGIDSTFVGSGVGYYPGDLPKLVKILIPNPAKPPDDICKLEVKDINGNLLFSASGKCPIVFKVACGNCPPGEMECATDTYPGYCCIPCSEIRSGIASATAAVRSLNNG